MDSLPSIGRALNISVASLLDESENPWRDYMERRFSHLEEKIEAVLDDTPTRLKGLNLRELGHRQIGEVS